MIGWLASEFLPWLAMIAAALAGAWGYGKSRAAAPRTAAARGSGKRAAGPWLYGPEPSCCSP